MIVSYERIISDFLSKITEYRFLNLPQSSRDEIVIGYLKRAATDFSVECREKIVAFDDEAGTLEMENSEIDEIELCNILSDGMVYYWFYPAMHNQKLLENTLNTNCVRFCSNAVHKIPTELLEHPESFLGYNVWMKYAMA